MGFSPIKKRFFWISVFFLLLLPGATGATVNQTFDISTYATDGELTASGNPFQRLDITESGIFSNAVTLWGGETVVSQSGLSPGITLRDRTAGVSYWLQLEGETDGTDASLDQDFMLWTTTTPIYLDASHDYEFFSPNYNFRRRSPSSTYNSGNEWDEAGHRNNIPDGTVTKSNYDWYLRVTYTSISTSTIAFTTTPSSTCDFWGWPLDTFLTQADLAVSASWTAQVMLSPTGPTYGFLQYQDNFGFIPPRRSVIGKTLDLVEGYAYYAKAFLCSSTDTDDCDFSISSNRTNFMEAESDWWEFIVLEGSTDDCPIDGGLVTSPGLATPSATSTAAGDNITCDQADGFFGSSMCYLFQYLFLPDPGAMTKFGDLKDALAAKPPFGYLTAYQQLWAQVGVSSTVATTTPTMSWTGFTFMTTLRTLIGYLFWGLFGAYVVVRFKNFVP